MSDALIRELTRAWECLQAGDAAGAQLLCQAVLQRAPRNPDALYLLGVTHLMAGRPRDAVAALQQAITVQPQHGADAWKLELPSGLRLFLIRIAGSGRARNCWSGEPVGGVQMED